MGSTQFDSIDLTAPANTVDATVERPMAHVWKASDWPDSYLEWPVAADD